MGLEINPKAQWMSGENAGLFLKRGKGVKAKLTEMNGKAKWIDFLVLSLSEY